MNRVVFTGRVTKDVTLKMTPSGKAVTQFTLAVDRPYANDGDIKADFFYVVAWNKIAEVISKYCPKGSKILIEGRLLNRSYKDKNGVDRYITEIQAENVEFLDVKKKEKTGAITDPPIDEDIPF